MSFTKSKKIQSGFGNFHSPFVPIVLTSLLYMIAVFNACKTSHLTQNVAYRYSGKSVVPELKVKTHFISEDSVKIYLGLSTSEINFDTAGLAYFSILFRLYENENGKPNLLRDSLQILTVASFNNTPTTIFEVNIAAPSQRNYFLTVYLVEENTRKGYKGQTGIWRNRPENKQDEQNYFIKNANQDEVMFSNITKINTPLRLFYKNKTYSHFTIYYYKPIKNMALPPYSTLQEVPIHLKPDSIFFTTAFLNPNQEGLYYIQADTNRLSGLSILCVDSSFPKITTASDLIESLRYITRNEEYEQMMKATNPKAAVDEFWLTRAGSPNRGKVLIKEFYSRVQRANVFFTTYKEGWKTDRGIIYIIYGQPDIVNIFPDSENWTYYPKGNQSKLQFQFVREELPFTIHHYRLIKNPDYEMSWQNAVYEWRNGFINNLTE